MKQALFVGSAVGLLCVLGYIVEGPSGVVAASVTVAVLGASGARLAAAGRPFVPPDPDKAQGPSGFPAFQRITTTLRWTPTNGRYFEAVTRPFLVSITTVLLADRRRLDIERDAPQAVALIGTDGWDLLYADKPRDRNEPVPIARIAALVDKLEQL